MKQLKHEQLQRIESDYMARGLPVRMWGGIKRYLSDGIPPGDFLTALISNDLLGCVSHADDENVLLLHHYIKFLYNGVPGNCWGSPKRFEEWINASYEWPPYKRPLPGEVS